MRLVPTREEEREMREAAGILTELSTKAHEKLGDLIRRRSVLLMELGRRKATGEPVEDLEAEMKEIDQKSEKLAALRNRARGAANEADELWDMWLRKKRQLPIESEKFDSSTESLYRIVREVMEGGGMGEDEEWWDEVLSLVDDEWVSRFSGSVIWRAIKALRWAKALLFPRSVPRVYTSREEAIGFGTSNVKAKLKEDVQSVINLCNELETLLGGVRIEDSMGWIMKEHVIDDVRQIREGMKQLLKEIEEGSADVSAVDLLFGEVPHALRERISGIVQYIEDEQTAKNLENKGQKLVQALTSLERLYRFYRTLVGVREGVGYPPHGDRKLEMIFATGWSLKGAVIDDIREVLDLMEELEALVKRVETSTENRFGQRVKNEFIAAVEKAKRAMTNAFNELVKEQGLVELSGQTEADFLRWTNRAPGGGANIFTVGVSNLIRYSEVTDESLKQSLEKTGREISETLGRLEFWYKNYRDTCRLYEEYKAKSEGR